MISAMLSAQGFYPTKYRYTQFHYLVVYSVPRWVVSCSSEILQMVCSVLLAAKLLRLAVVGAVPKSNPSLSKERHFLVFLGYFCLGTSLTVQRWR